MHGQVCTHVTQAELAFTTKITVQTLSLHIRSYRTPYKARSSLQPTQHPPTPTCPQTASQKLVRDQTYM